MMPWAIPDPVDSALSLILAMMQANYIGESEASQVISTQTVSNAWCLISWGNRAILGTVATQYVQYAICGQIFNLFKFENDSSGTTWRPYLELMQCSIAWGLGPLCLWQCFLVEFPLSSYYHQVGEEPSPPHATSFLRINSTLAILLLDQVAIITITIMIIMMIIPVAASFLPDTLLCDRVQARQWTWVDYWW